MTRLVYSTTAGRVPYASTSPHTRDLLFDATESLQTWLTALRDRAQCLSREAMRLFAIFKSEGDGAAAASCLKRGSRGEVRDRSEGATVTMVL